MPEEAEVPAGGGWRLLITYENLFWLGIFLLAIVTRFWDLGSRGIHHDESLHAVYGRNLYIGVGYQHDPMMHGPLQFHLIALMYWLFGTTDATARFASVLCGIWVVMSPYFLRRQMGRLTALVAGFLFLISPSILYFSRMAREDAIFSGMEMIMIVGLWRFVSTRRPADFFIFCAGLSLMFTIKESAYLTSLVLAVFFLGLFALQSGYAILAALGGYVAALGGFALWVKSNMVTRDVNGQVIKGSIPDLPTIPSTNPSYDMIVGFMGQLFTHPLVLGGIIITLIFIGTVIMLFRTQHNRMRSEQAVRSGHARARALRRSAGAGTGASVSSLPGRRLRARPVASDTRPDGHAPDAPVDETAPKGASLNVDAGAGAGAGAGADMGTNVGADAATTRPGQQYPEPDVEAEPQYEELWNPRRLDPRPGTILSHYEPGSLPHLLGALFSRPSVIFIGLAIAFAIYVVFYTVFFTDIPRGIVSGIFGSLGYWMEQQRVERGGQPWFYYLLLIPLYEPVAVFFSLAAGLFFSIRGLKWVVRRRVERYTTGEPGLGWFNTDRTVPLAKFSAFLPAFLIVWLGGVFVIYSWAGEKMPWLMVHMVRPAILLASLFVGALFATMIAHRRARLLAAGEFVDVPRHSTSTDVEAVGRARPMRRRARTGRTPSYAAGAVRVAQDPPWVAWNRPGSFFPVLSYLTVFTVLAMGWGLSMNALVASSDYTAWWVTWLFPIMLMILTLSYALWLGPARAFRYFGVAVLSAFLFYQFRSAVMLSYNQPDVPKEMAVYVQTSPDVTRVVHEMETYSKLTTGGLNTRVVYDSFTSWPFEWYLRDYTNKVFIGGGEATPSPDTPIMLLEYAKHTNDTKLEQDYVGQRYAMRWWFPEEWYKNEFIPGQDPKSSPFLGQIGGALHTVWVTLTEPQLTGTLWKYLVFREPPKPLGSEDMIVFVRKDALQQYHYAQYQPVPSTDLPVEPAERPEPGQ
jgi:predicted membrane-bound mannosyltransferase